LSHVYVYEAISIVVGAFLFGLFIGAIIGNRIEKHLGFWVFLTDIALFSLLVFFSIVLFKGCYQLSAFYYYAFGFLISLISGCQFLVVARSRDLYRKVPFRLFGADLIGSGVGVLFVGGVLAPVFGILEAVVTLILLKSVGIIRRPWRV
jgi:hypothetical protein